MRSQAPIGCALDFFFVFKETFPPAHTSIIEPISTRNAHTHGMFFLIQYTAMATSAVNTVTLALPTCMLRPLTETITKVIARPRAGTSPTRNALSTEPITPLQ